MNDKWSEEWKHALCNYCDAKNGLEGGCTNEDCPVHMLERVLEQVQQDAAVWTVEHALCNYCDTETSLEGYCTNEDCPVHLLESALEQVQQDAAARRTVNRPCCERCCDQSKEARIDTYIKQLKKKGHSDVEIDAKIKLLEGIL